SGNEVLDMGIHHPVRDFYCDSEERDTLVLMEVLTRRFKGIIVCDGWKPYSSFTNRIQRCWAHLLGDRWSSPIRLRRRFHCTELSRDSTKN
ncbi:MAG TPA: hypothetical protein ENF24_03065, partial [Methanosarcinales archaeon]|nr:hypothetical protein [Methanosarcinales archaeon]